MANGHLKYLETLLSEPGILFAPSVNGTVHPAFQMIVLHVLNISKSKVILGSFTLFTAFWTLTLGGGSLEFINV